MADIKLSISKDHWEFHYLQLEGHHDRLHHLASGQAGALHPLREDGGHEHVRRWPHPQPVGEARHHQTGDGEGGEGGPGEAQPHQSHPQASEGEEDGVEVAAVQPQINIFISWNIFVGWNIFGWKIF